MAKKVLIAGLALLMLFLALVLPTGGVHVERVRRQHEIYPWDTGEPTGFLEDGSFRTHLPLVILDIRGQEVPGLERTDERVLPCTYSIISHEDRLNSTADEPTESGSMTLAIRGNSSRIFPKKQYSVRLVDEQGLPDNRTLLDLPAESTWVLNGSKPDKSQLRNYLLYNISGEIMDYAPRCRLCEVLLTDEDGNYTYGGTYTLIEKIKVSENRLKLPEYDPQFVPSSFLVQMNADIDGVRISHLKPDEASAYYFDLEYPNALKATPETLSYIQDAVVTFEKLLYDADHTGNWDRVHEAIDLESFVDYYIINEFFQNYDAGTRSTYLYRPAGGKVSIGPVWDFDGTFDNFSRINMPVDILALNSTFYYFYLTQDPAFSKRCAERYAELRETVLSEERLLSDLEQSVAYLGPAAKRNSERWYPDGVESFRLDVEKMETFIRERGAWMDEAFGLYTRVLHGKDEHR